jgi:hypothetical protein
MGSAEDSIRRREQEVAYRQEQAQHEQRREAYRIREQVTQEIPLALGRLAALDYPGSEWMSIYEKKRSRFWGIKDLYCEPVGSVAAWILFKDEAGRGSYDSIEYVSYHLTSAGQIARNREALAPIYPTEFSETSGDPSILAAIQRLGVDDSPNTQ